MKIFCIFLIFVFTVSCGPSVLQKNNVAPRKTDVAQRKRECQLVRGVCKPECNSWEYIYNYCDDNPCCVVREYQKPGAKGITTTNKSNAKFNFDLFNNVLLHD
ncbi:beta-defensin 113 [Carlito syrichta]|uniref:Beta-defensin n=1 Tax=Carlito syrichta TaxID=1868482 RepID=A0A3Q0DJY3_CARSF|nr:beta-defensin 113 [Carlito syrichta]